MAGTDVYNNTTVVAGNWSDTVTFTPAAGGTPASIQIGGTAGTDAVLTSGTITAPGQAVTISFSTYGGTVQEQLQSVCDVSGGAVFVDSVGDYFVFSASPLTPGASYAAVSGFGAFSAADGSPACFVAGTRIETQDGMVAVEDLRPGDQVRGLLRAARGGGFAPVVWTGRMQIACARHPNPADVWPIRVAAHAFGPGRPSRAVLLSPDHAVYEQGVLVPVRLLVNDATIAPMPLDQVTYWHVELPSHDVVLAEGLPAESYLDTGNRGAFTAAATGRLPARASVVPISAGGAGDLVSRIWEQLGCARLVTGDTELMPVRRRLREHARIEGWRETRDAGLELHGVTGSLSGGWDGTVATGEIPPGASTVRLLSRGVVPCLLGDGSLDARRLGVAVTRLRIDGRDVRLDDPRMRDGWHRMEEGWRWTDGAAAIPLTPMRRARGIEIHTAPMLPYWQAPEQASEAGRRAA